MNFKGQFFLVLFSFFALIANAQDGESLFKAKCAACHMLGKDGTGPNLKDVKQKWEEAGEGDLIYKWVINSQELVAAGNSQLALKADQYSAISMPPQQVSNEEIDAILGFVNDFAPPPPPKEEETAVASTSGEKEVKYVPNYKKNLKLFYWLIIALVAQVIAIMSVSGSLKTMIKLDKDKKSKSSTNVIIALVGMFGFMSMSNKTLALEFMQPGLAEEGAPWLLVEDADLVVLVILNIVMLFVFLHFRKLFMDITKTIRPQTEKQKQLSKRQERKLNKILVGAVDIEEEHTILMHHEYDGIKELDNNLPPWWVWMFWATIVFAVVYVFNYHILGTADLQIAEYEKDMKQSEKLVQAYLKEQGMQIDASNVTLMEDEAELATGETIFEANCTLCHNPNGEGNIGPNLTDNTWIYGYDIATVFTVVKDGTTKGMPEHASKLNPIQLQQVSSFILSMPEAQGKAPEGDLIEK